MANSGSARYVFGVSFRIEPSTPGTTVEPATFETDLYREADAPGREGWLFFRDNLWHGELSDPAHFRDRTEDALGVRVDDVSFSELRTDGAYLDALRDEVGSSLGEFNADTVDEALSKYLGSSIRVVD
ncbi:LWR-salt protein [Halostella litorea]|uniref:LWR-salt protein n=1 Tax=Halostella litorea TaxID=2528831 RepID=UPI0010921416|nr:LWR-salt protein [Halostella litorea]